jgi:hypothetical protein
MLCKLAAAFLLVAPTLAQYQSVTYSGSTFAQPDSWGGLSANVGFPQFDPALGQLREVSYHADALLIGGVGYENLNAASCVLIYGHPYVSGGVGVPGVSDPAGGFLSVWDYGITFSPATLDVFDGTIDYAGTSGWRADFNTGPYFWGGSYQSSMLPIPAWGMSTLVGSGSLNAGVGVNPATWQYSSCDGQSPNISINNYTGVAVSFSITYYFEDYPARFCTHAGYFGYACPCDLAPPLGYDFGPNGCPNSVSHDGADLASSGHSRVLADDFAITASNMPSLTSVLFFQGTSASYPGAPLGDGLRCAGGQLIRLGVGHASGGAASYPGARDPSISIRGFVPVGAYRTYQAWYRDPAAGFCTSATSNLTSAVATIWTP